MIDSLALERLAWSMDASQTSQASRSHSIPITPMTKSQGTSTWRLLKVPCQLSRKSAFLSCLLSACADPSIKRVIVTYSITWKTRTLEQPLTETRAAERGRNCRMITNGRNRTSYILLLTQS